MNYSMKIDNLTEVIQKMQEKIDSLENSNRKEVIKKLDHVTEQVDANLRKHGNDTAKIFDNVIDKVVSENEVTSKMVNETARTVVHILDVIVLQTETLTKRVESVEQVCKEMNNKIETSVNLQDKTDTDKYIRNSSTDNSAESELRFTHDTFSDNVQERNVEDQESEDEFPYKF